MSKRTQAILIGGGAAGVANALPFPDLLNFVCCALVVGGAVLSVYLAFRGADKPERPLASGAMIGAMAGVVAAVVSLVVSIPVESLVGDPSAEWWQTWLQSLGQGMGGGAQIQIGGPENADQQGGIAVRSAVRFVIEFVIEFFAFPVFGALGGLLGGAIFGRNK